MSNITNADRPFGSRRIRRALSVGALAFGTTMLSVALPVAGSSFLTPGISTAQAQTPMTITGRVQDTTNVLGDTSELNSKISELSKNHNIDLHVLTIDKFESPEEAKAWTEETAKKNSYGNADAILVIATESRRAYFAAGSNKALSSDQQSEVYQKYIKPKLQSGDYKGAALEAVNGINAQKGGISPAVAIGGGALGVAGVAGAGYYIMKRRRSKNEPGSTPAYSTSKVPEVSLEELRTRAGAALVQADNSMVQSKQELEFARAQYGNEHVKPFEEELTRAQELMQASFHRQKLLNDDVPDTVAEQRAWLSEIIDNSQEISDISRDQAQKLSEMRNLEHEAPQAIARLQGRIPELQQIVETAQHTYARLKDQYLPSALEPVSKSAALLDSHQRLVTQELQEASRLVDTSRSEAVVHLRNAEESAAQITSLAKAVSNHASALESAQSSLSTDILSIQRDVAEAKSLAESQNRAELAATAAGMEAILGQVSQQAQERPNDPIALTEQLHQLTSELNRSMSSLRADREREQAAKESLSRTLRSAEAQVRSASDFINNRRRGVGSQARTYLSEAQTALNDAHRLRESDPVNSLNRAYEAISLASDAQNSANQDVNNYWDDNRYGQSYGGDSLAQGMLLGAIFSAMGSHSASASTGHHWGGGDSGGGWDFGGGGGDFGGGDGGSF